MDTRILFAGICIAVLGLLILAYDLPQLAYVESGAGQAPLQDGVERDLYRRVQTEAYVGMGILGAGAAMIVWSRTRPDA